MQKHIALITGYGWAGITVSLAMSIEYLTSKGFFVDIYLETNSLCDELGLNKPLFNYSNTRIFFYETQKDDNTFIPYENLQIKQKDLNFVKFIKEKKTKYEALIAYDPHAIIRAGIFSLKLKIKYYYFSLEFYEKKDFIKEAEIFYVQKAERIMTQDKYRAKILSCLLKVNINKMSVVYNSTIGKIITKKSSYFRDMFNIPKTKKIILASGTLMNITGFDKILDSLKNMQEDYVLVAHGWTSEKKIKEKTTKCLIEFPDKFFYSSKTLSHNKKFDIFASADIGLIYYEPEDLNLKYAAWSSGKFFDFMRCGVPVLANELPNMKKLVHTNKVGLVINDFTNMNNEYDYLIKNQKEYYINCHKTYNKYSFYTSFQNAVEGIIKNDY